MNAVNGFSSRINFLCHVLLFTFSHAHVESYLKNLLNYFTIEELEKTRFDRYSVLHFMSCHSSSVSSNAFQIIINYGININIKNIANDTAAHTLMCCAYNNHTSDILNLLINNGINLNVINIHGNTVLDVLAYRIYMNEAIENSIMTLIDSGAKTNRPSKNSMVHDFIEYYKNTTIKPAIKNEN